MLNPAEALAQSSQLPSLEQTRLLVSVTSATEAAIARENGADWIDLKNPSSGSLGAPTSTAARSVLEALSAFPRTSIALGELREIECLEPRALVASHAVRFPIAKVGLSGLTQQHDWRHTYQQLVRCVAPTRLVPVLYADGPRCDAVGVRDVIELIQANTPPFLLIDTYFKDGQRLLDWFHRDELKAIQEKLAPLGTRLVLAGSLQLTDLPLLLPLSPAAIAVRGAVCKGDRTAALSGELVRQWSQQLRRGR